MILPDVNLLLYAVIADYPLHPPARDWWLQRLHGTETVGLAPVVAHGFIRISTNPRLHDRALSPVEATGLIEQWTQRPMVRVLGTGTRHLKETLTLICEVGTAGNLTTDAQIAAHARLENAIVATNDTDFGRFPDIRTVNPLRD